MTSSTLPTTLLLSSAGLLLLGCSETGLQHAPPTVDSDGLVLDIDDGDPGNGTGGPSSNGPRGPWDQLDPGNLPDEYFAMAWRPEPCADCWDDLYGVETGWRIDIVDLEGQVIVEFERPFQDPAFLFERFEPAADGTLLVVEHVRRDTNYHLPSIWQQRVWRADVITGETQEILRMSSQRVEMPQSGRGFDFPRTAGARFAADPTNPDVLWIASQGNWNSGLSLVRVDLVDPDAEPVFHDLSALSRAFGLDPETYWSSVPTSLVVERVGLDIEVILTVEGALIYADPWDLPRGVVTYRPGDGALESVINLRRRVYLADVRFGSMQSPEDTRLAAGTALLQVGAPRSYCSSAQFAIVEPGRFTDAGEGNPWETDPNEPALGVEPIQGDESMTCARLGPLLDHAGPTFVYWGERHSTDYVYTWPPSRIALSHRGQDVWSWDSLRLGLRTTDFRMLGLERVVVP